MSSNKNQVELEKTPGDNISTPLTETEVETRAEEAKLDDAMKPEVGPAGAIAKPKGKVKQAVAAVEEKTQDIHERIKSEYTDLFEKARSTATAHIELARVNGHHSIAAAWQNLTHIINATEKTIGKTAYAADSRLHQQFKKNDKPASSGNNSSFNQSKV